MSMTPNLQLTHVLPSQSNKEVTINALADGLDIAMNDGVTIDLSAGGATLTVAQMAQDFCFVGSGHTVARTVNLPAMKRFFAFRNAGTADVTLVRGSTSLVVTPGVLRLYYLDGTTNGLFQTTASVAAGTRVYVASGFRPGTLTNGETLLRVPITETVTFPASFSGSYGIAITGPGAATTFDIRRNGSSIGSMSFAVSATTATFSMTSATTFSPGDVLAVVAPNPVDTTIAGVGFALRGTF